MANEIEKALGDLRPDDIRLDSLGRVIITSPSIIDRLREVGDIKPDDALARSDTNVICCGNGSCPSEGQDLGAIMERFTAGGVAGLRSMVNPNPKR
jgi:hypothetical protein